MIVVVVVVDPATVVVLVVDVLVGVVGAAVVVNSAPVLILLRVNGVTPFIIELFRAEANASRAKNQLNAQSQRKRDHNWCPFSN